MNTLNIYDVAKMDINKMSAHDVTLIHDLEAKCKAKIAAIVAHRQMEAAEFDLTKRETKYSFLSGYMLKCFSINFSFSKQPFMALVRIFQFYSIITI